MKKFKKYILPLLIVATVLALLFSLAACGDKNVNDNNENPDDPGETKDYEDLSEGTAMDLFLIAGQPTLPDAYTITITFTDVDNTEKYVYGSLGKSDTSWYVYQDEETTYTELFVKKEDEFYDYNSLYGFRKFVEWEFLAGVNALRDFTQTSLMYYALNVIDEMVEEYNILRGDATESYSGKEYDSGIREATYTADAHNLIYLPDETNMTPAFGKVEAKKTFDAEDQVTEMVLEFKADQEYVAPGLDEAKEKCVVVIDRQTPVAPEIPSTATEVPPDTTATLSFDGISSEIDSGRGDLTDYFETDFETTGLTPGGEMEIPQVLHFPDSDGYVTTGIFQGWYYDQELTIPVEETDNAKYKVVLGYTGQTTLYPKFNMNIDYQLVGGEFPDGKAEMTAYTLNAILSIIPEKTGYAFDGWYAESTYQTNWATVTDRVYPPEHAKFYAKWVKKVKVSYETNINGYKIAEDLATPGEAMEQYPTPIAEGKVFDGWYLDEGLTQSADGLVITEDITLYAKYR